MKIKLRDLLPTGSANIDRVNDFSSRKTRFPSIEIIRERADDAKWYIVDGNHRALAALKRGDKDIDAFESHRESGVIQKLLRIFRGY